MFCHYFMLDDNHILGKWPTVFINSKFIGIIHGPYTNGKTDTCILKSIHFLEIVRNFAIVKFSWKNNLTALENKIMVKIESKAIRLPPDLIIICPHSLKGWG